MSALLRRFCFCVCLVFCASFLPAQAQRATVYAARNMPGVHLSEIPLAFERNEGQAGAGMDYLVRSNGMLASLNAAQVRLVLSAPSGSSSQQFSLQLIGANTAVSPVASEEQQGRSNYLIGPADMWRTQVKRFGRVTYAGVYAGVDLTHYGEGSRLEHDFVVQAGASPSQIRFRMEGAESLEITPEGDLRATQQGRAVVLRRPVAYQLIDQVQYPVDARFLLANGTVSFDLGAYDRSRLLVIDPVLDYSTFLGDASVYVTGMAVDAAGNTYVTGEAPAAFPASASTAACKNCVSASNKLAVYVTKLNSSGTAVLYSTFIGGSTSGANTPSNDQSNAVTVDSAGNAIVTGWTSSSDFPLKNSIAAGTPSYQDGFLTSLTPDGSALNFSSRLGGSTVVSAGANVYPTAVTTDAQNNVYVTGTSQSSYLPVTTGALNAVTPSYNTTAGFLLKLSQAGALGFGAVVGKVGSASGGTGPTALAVDATGVIYMAGTTGPTDYGLTTPAWPVAAGAYQSQFLANSLGAPFVTRVSADGSAILSSTLVGAGSAVSIALTASQDVLITGSASYNFPITSDAYAKNVGTNVNSVTTAGASAYFAKVSHDGSQLLYSSVFGMSGAAVTMSGIAQDLSGNVWLAGTTTSGLTLVHPLQSVLSNQLSGTGFVAKLDPDMHNMLFSSYVNSVSGFSQVHAFAVDANGLGHVAGIASMDFPTTSQAAVRSVTPPPANYFYNYGFAAAIDSVTPGPSICMSGANGVTAQLGSSATGSFTVTNCGDGPLTISAINLVSDVYAIASTTTCTGTIAAAASCKVFYVFTPKLMGSASATVTLTTNAPMAANSRVLTSSGTAPVVYLQSGNSITFNSTVLGATPQTVDMFIVNRGTAPLTVDTTRTTIGGPFAIVSTTCSSTPVVVNSFCAYVLSFTPTSAGTSTGALTLYTNDPATPISTVALSGSAFSSYPTPTLNSPVTQTVSLDGGVVSMTLQGTNIFAATQVLVNGVNATVTARGDTSIIFKVDPATLGTLGEFPIQIVNPAPGGASSAIKVVTYHSVALTSTAVVYEPHSKLLYAAIPALSATNPNTIVSLDPVTGKFGTPIPVAVNPVRLTLSDDGHYLYVGFYFTYSSNGEIQRIDLTTNAVDRTFTLPGSSDGTVGLHAVPGQPQQVVASLARAASPTENGVALFNDNGLVQYIPNDYANHYYSLDNFAFTSDGIYYGYPFTSGFFVSAAVISGGIVPVNSSLGGSCCDQTSGSIVVSDGALLYTNSGQIWDPKAKTLLGRYDSNLFYEADVLADVTAKRTFILSGNYQPVSGGYAGPAIRSYDPASVSLAGVLALTPESGAQSLTRWGADGFAFLSGVNLGGSYTDPGSESKLILLRSSLATPTAGSGPAITGASPVNLPVGSPASTVTLTGTGFASDAVVLWNGNQRTTTYSSATSVQVQLTAADLQVAGTGQLIVKNVAAAQNSGVSYFQVVGNPISFTPASLSYATQQTGTTSPTRVVSLTNISGATLTSLSLDFTGTDALLFAKDTSCTSSLAAGASCTITVSFKPDTTGNKTATLTVSQAGTAITPGLALTGLAAVPSFSVSASSYDFGVVGTGLSNGRGVATVKNTSGLMVSNIRVAISGTNSADFTTDGTCGSITSLPPPGSTCAPGIYFSPQSLGAKSATVTISADGAVSQTVQVTGQGAKVGLSMTPLSLDYGNVIVGTPATKVLSFTNTGDVTLGPVRAVFANSTVDYYQVGSSCPLFNPNDSSSTWSVAPGQTCTFSLVEAPEKLDITQNSFTFGLQSFDGFTSPLLNVARPTVSYTVNGIAPLQLGSSSVDLGSIALGQTSDSNVTLTNTATYGVTLSGAVNGANAADFTYTSGCPAVIPAGTGCTLRVHFAPSAAGARAASLTLIPASATPYFGRAFSASQAVALSGTGVADFVVGSTSTTSAVPAGQAATYSLSVVTASGLQGSVALSCSNLPQYASCSFSPSSVAPGSAPSAVSLSISTQQTVTASSRQNDSSPSSRGWYQVSSASLIVLCLFGLRRGRAAATRALHLCALLIVSSALMWSIAGCAGSSSQSSSGSGSGAGSGSGSGAGSGSGSGAGGGTTSVTRTTAPGTYAIQVNAVDSGMTHSITVSLVVQ
jgi:hypothetical protein